MDMGHFTDTLQATYTFTCMNSCDIHLYCHNLHISRTDLQTQHAFFDLFLRLTWHFEDRGIGCDESCPGGMKTFHTVLCFVPSMENPQTISKCLFLEWSEPVLVPFCLVPILFTFLLPSAYRWGLQMATEHATHFPKKDSEMCSSFQLCAF